MSSFTCILMRYCMNLLLCHCLKRCMNLYLCHSLMPSIIQINLHIQLPSSYLLLSFCFCSLTYQSHFIASSNSHHHRHLPNLQEVALLISQAMVTQVEPNPHSNIWVVLHISWVLLISFFSHLTSCPSFQVLIASLILSQCMILSTLLLLTMSMLLNLDCAHSCIWSICS
jgi:hypothetical protein